MYFINLRRLAWPPFIFFFCAIEFARADALRFYTDISDRFVHKDWVAYKSKTRGCTAATEFIANGSIVMLTIDRSIAGNDFGGGYEYRPFIYGEYVNKNPIKRINIDAHAYNIDMFSPLRQSFVEKLALGSTFNVTFRLTDGDTLTSELSLAGSSAALRYCGFIN